MRVDSAKTSQRSADAGVGSRRFGAALRGARDASRRTALAAETSSMGTAQPLGTRRLFADRKDAGLRERRDVFRDDERQVAPAAAPVSAPPALARDVSPVAELRAAVRALPPAIEASRVRDGAPLSMAFGRALSVDVRSGPAGLELSLRADPALARAAAAELPGLVGALRARGLRVARADVLPRAHGAPAAAHDAR